MNFPQQPTPANSYTPYNNRRVTIIGLHHTATPNDPLPGGPNNLSWHFLISRALDPTNPAQALTYATAPLTAAAHTVGNTSRWRPPSVLRSPDGRTSDFNYCGVNVEITYAPQAPYFQVPTPQQYTALTTLLRWLYNRYGVLPIVGHGEVDKDKLLTEPNPGMDTFALYVPLTARNQLGRFLETDVVPISDEDLKAYLEQLGTPVNMSTALVQRAALAYRRGETRGPAISGEYDYPEPSGPQVRQDFTAATAYYDKVTGGVGWVELNLERR